MEAVYWAKLLKVLLTAHYLVHYWDFFNGSFCGMTFQTRNGGFMQIFWVGPLARH